MTSNRPYPLYCFTKPLGHLSPEELTATVADLGFDGLDLTIRDTGPVTPDNAEQLLPRVQKLAADRGLTIGMITLPIECVDPDRPEWIGLFHLCGRAGIPFMKLGYWNYDGKDYRAQLRAIRKSLAGFELLAKAAGTCALVHVHTNTIGQSASLLERMIEGFDPKAIGAYLDTHHLCARGEDFDMAMDLAGAHLKVIAVKDSLRIKPAPEFMLQPFHHHVRMVPLGEGIVNFDRFIDALNRRGYSGPLSYHLEFDVPREALRKVIRKDVEFIAGLGLAAPRRGG